MGNAENENIENMDDLNVKNNPFAKNESEIEQETDETAAEETVASEIDSLKEQLEKVNNQYIRLAADFDNYRIRLMQERESLLNYGAEDILIKMI